MVLVRALVAACTLARAPCPRSRHIPGLTRLDHATAAHATKALLTARKRPRATPAVFMPELFSAAMRVTAVGGEAGDAPERALVRGPEKVAC